MPTSAPGSSRQDRFDAYDMPRGSRFLLRRHQPPRRSIRLRLTLAYLALFVVSAAGLLTLTILFWHAINGTAIVTGDIGGLHRTASPGATKSLVAIDVTTQYNADYEHLLLAAGIALVIFAAFAVALGWMASGWLLRPVRAITTTAKEISASNLHERLNLSGPHDELRELGDTFDDLLARLERAFASERQFVANASHELRTPNATMRVWLDVAMAKPEPVPSHIAALAERLRAELDHVDELVDSFLALAYAQNGQLNDETLVSLSALVAAALEQQSETIAHQSLTIDQDLHDHAWVIGSKTLLSHMVNNLVDNAVKHNQPDGWIHVATTHSGENSGLVIENGGPQLAQAELAELVMPFRRLGAERTGSHRGSGLGLSIVESVIEVHTGTLDLVARPGGGLRAAISLPATVPTVAGGSR